MVKHKSKFNKSKCTKCMYHGGCGGIYCNYATITGKTALRIIDGREADARGEDFNNCKLYEKGKPKNGKFTKWV